jgi:hypothetical protein
MFLLLGTGMIIAEALMSEKIDVVWRTTDWTATPNDARDCRRDRRDNNNMSWCETRDSNSANLQPRCCRQLMTKLDLAELWVSRIGWWITFPSSYGMGATNIATFHKQLITLSSRHHLLSW